MFARVLPADGLWKRRPTTFQLNVGYRCNQACTHCHVEAGPSRRETVTPDVLATCLEVLRRRPGFRTVDITGGAPELVPGLADFLDALRPLGREVLFRTNLTALLEAGPDPLLDRLEALDAEVIASLPCYEPAEVDPVRGQGVFDRSLVALRLLNRRGWGVPGGRTLSLMFNPMPAVLPPPQDALEAEYREVLGGEHGIAFTRVLALTNLPVGRFRTWLADRGELARYEQLLRDNHTPANLDRVMCRDTLSVAWDGHLYDCEFNQALRLPTLGPSHLSALLAADWPDTPVTVGDHCYACTAGAGASCRGALS